ncbi:hypothetical protein STRMOE7_30055 [Streptomyces sp. MOE7]|nr:hypothetical protein STRMOE7_30055 [Streptomyces sp. MOE7]
MICFSTSQAALCWVPPYRPAVEPEISVFAFELPAFTGVGDGEAVDVFAVDLVTGFWPTEAAGSANTSVWPPPPGRVRTTAAITAATTMAAMIATRGADRHQGCPPPAPPPPPPPPPRGPRGPPGGPGREGWRWGSHGLPTCVGSCPCEGRPEGAPGGPESGPVGGPVGWLSGGGGDVTGPSSGAGGSSALSGMPTFIPV